MLQQQQYFGKALQLWGIILKNNEELLYMFIWKWTWKLLQFFALVLEK